MERFYRNDVTQEKMKQDLTFPPAVSGEEDSKKRFLTSEFLILMPLHINLMPLALATKTKKKKRRGNMENALEGLSKHHLLLFCLALEVPAN